MVQAHPREALSGLVLYQVCSTGLSLADPLGLPTDTGTPRLAATLVLRRPDGEACSLADPSTWCCNLEAHHCVRTQCGIVDEIRQICSALKNCGINCETCKAAPQCRA